MPITSEVRPGSEKSVLLKRACFMLAFVAQALLLNPGLHAVNSIGTVTIEGTGIDAYKETSLRRGLMPEFILVDIDAAENYASEHLDGAVSFPAMSPAELDIAYERLKQLQDRRVDAGMVPEFMFYAHKSVRTAGEAARKLKALGLTKVGYLDFSLDDWKSSGQPVVTRKMLNAVPEKLAGRAVAGAGIPSGDITKMGFDVEPGEINITNFAPLGEMLSYSKLENRKLQIKNLGPKKRTFRIYVYTCSESNNRVFPGCEDIPDTSWVTPEQAEFEITGNSMKEIDLFVKIPAGKAFAGKKYQCILEILMDKENPEDMYVLSVQANMLISTKVKESGFNLKIITAGDVTTGDDYGGEIKFLPALVKNYEDFKITKIDPESEEGKSLIGKLKINFLPAYIFERKIEKLEKTPEIDIADLIKNRILNKLSDGSYAFTTIARPGIFIDRKRTPNTLDVFSVCQTPGFVEVSNELLTAKRDGRIPDDLKLDFHYIVPQSAVPGAKPDHSLPAVQPEVEETIRQLYVKKNYPDKYFSYILARNEDPFTTFWSKAFTAIGADDKKMTEFFYSAGYDKILKDDMKKSSELGIDIGTGSPIVYFLYENKILVIKPVLLRNFYGLENVFAKKY
jgi:rhodanese-related sulfurtransferase